MHWPCRITWRSVKSDPHILRSADLRLIDEFVAEMRRGHYAAKTVARYRCCLVQTACSLKRGLGTLRREDVAGVTRRLFGRTTSARRMARGTLHTWLKFVGRFPRRGPAAPWQRWLDDYGGFMEADRGLASISRYQYLRVAQRYLWWQFRAKAAAWRRVSCADIWRYAAKLRRDGYSPRSLNLELCVLRQFLRFVHLRGHGPRLLADAVPTFSERGRAPRCDVATDEERRRLLSSFDRRTPTGRRDHAMAICMAELGLRCVEVARLRLSHLDWKEASLAVPAAKGGRGRVLPLPTQVATALRGYIQIRPPTDHDFLFVGIGTLAEALQLRARDIHDGIVLLHGKGRKEREVPLWPQTARQLRRWCTSNKITPDQLVFTNRLGGPLSHDGVSCRLDLAVKQAASQCPSLKGRRITSHRFRNSCAMALLQAGVPLEVIALYLGHSRPITTHAYVEADLKMKADCLRRLTAPKMPKDVRRDEQSRLLAFLEAVR